MIVYKWRLTTSLKLDRNVHAKLIVTQFHLLVKVDTNLYLCAFYVEKTGVCINANQSFYCGKY